jgi:ketosteroid isomerase-like protein
MERHRAFAESMYDAINRRDLDAFVAGVSEDVEFRSLIADVEGQVYRGHEGVREWWVNVSQLLGGLGFEMEEYAEEDDVGVIRVRVRGNLGTTGIEQTMWQAVLVQDGKATWWQTFRSEDEAWAAARERART